MVSWLTKPADGVDGIRDRLEVLVVFQAELLPRRIYSQAKPYGSGGGSASRS